MTSPRLKHRAVIYVPDADLQTWTRHAAVPCLYVQRRQDAPAVEGGDWFTADVLTPLRGKVTAALYVDSDEFRMRSTVAGVVDADGRRLYGVDQLGTQDAVTGEITGVGGATDGLTVLGVRVIGRGWRELELGGLYEQSA